MKTMNQLIVENLHLNHDLCDAIAKNALALETIASRLDDVLAGLQIAQTGHPDALAASTRMLRTMVNAFAAQGRLKHRQSI